DPCGDDRGCQRMRRGIWSRRSRCRRHDLGGNRNIAGLPEWTESDDPVRTGAQGNARGADRELQQDGSRAGRQGRRRWRMNALVPIEPDKEVQILRDIGTIADKIRQARELFDEGDAMAAKMLAAGSYDLSK